MLVARQWKSAGYSREKISFRGIARVTGPRAEDLTVFQTAIKLTVLPEYANEDDLWPVRIPREIIGRSRPGVKFYYDFYNV